MTTTSIQVTKYCNDGDIFYLIEGKLYFSDEYGMHCIGGPTWGKNQYTYEEFIKLDPACAISARKRSSEITRSHTDEELIVFNLVENLIAFALDHDWSKERILTTIKNLGINDDAMWKAIDLSVYSEHFES